MRTMGLYMKGWPFVRVHVVMGHGLSPRAFTTAWRNRVLHLNILQVPRHNIRDVGREALTEPESRSERYSSAIRHVMGVALCISQRLEVGIDNLHGY